MTSFIENTSAEDTSFRPTWKQLRYANRTLPVPFEIQLTDHDALLTCEEIIRIVPTKRLVAYALWGELPVVVKLFYDARQAEHHVEREIQGLEDLEAVNIPSAKILWQGTAQKGKIQVLIFERIVNGCNLEDIWINRVNNDELIPLMKAVTIELATQHVLGIVQHDLHLKNFFITNSHIYTLDAGSISSSFEILPRQESLNHLALFFSQLGVGTDELQTELFKVYAKVRGWFIKKEDVAYLKQSIIKWNGKRWNQFKKKLQRTSSTFAYRKQLTDHCIYNQNYYSNELETFFENPDSFFHPSSFLKNGGSSTVTKIKLDNRFVVVKRYNMKSFLHWLRRCVRPTRAAKSWRIAQQLHLFGIPTAKPIAYLEKRFLGLRGKSYFLMEYIEGPHLGEFFANPENKEHFETMAAQVQALFENLAKLRLTHGDLKMTNILIHKNRPYLIDLDGVIEHQTKLSLKKAYRKELERFMKNWEHQPSVKVLFQKIFNQNLQRNKQ